MPAQIEAVDEQVTGAKKKRESKKSRKEEERLAKLEAAGGYPAAQAEMTAETPLKLNFAMLVAQERREAIL